jgi:SH3-like domain-containing protein
MNYFDIRHCCSAVLAAGIACFAAATAYGESYLYTARIVAPAVHVQSGPGESFYITDTLTEGEEVEVYRQRPDGWCAIRPPQGSFSWVFGPHLRLLGDSLAEIDKEDVASRIGSRLSQRRNAVQVRLKKGEVVQVVGEASDEGKKWYKIAPPAGEFRWIHVNDIRPVGSHPVQLEYVTAASAESFTPEEPIEQESNHSLDASIVTTAATVESSAGAQPSVPVTDSSNATPADWRAAPIAPPLATTANSDLSATTTSPATTAGNTNDAPAAQAAAASSSTAQPSAPPTAPPSATKVNSPPAVGTLLDDLDRQLADLELRLSRMVSEPPATWQTSQLVQDAKRLLAQTNNPADQSAVRVTLDKANRFAAIEQRYRQIATRTSPLSASSGATADVTPVGPASDPAAAPSPPEGGRYDAVGILRPVVSKRPGAPQFALVDGRGQVVSFVSATPDVNLQPYLGRRVGVVGNRGFIPEFHRAHVTAGRVMPLEERVVR